MINNIIFKHRKWNYTYMKMNIYHRIYTNKIRVQRSTIYSLYLKQPASEADIFMDSNRKKLVENVAMLDWMVI